MRANRRRIAAAIWEALDRQGAYVGLANPLDDVVLDGRFDLLAVADAVLVEMMEDE